MTTLSRKITPNTLTTTRLPVGDAIYSYSTSYLINNAGSKLITNAGAYFLFNNLDSVKSQTKLNIKTLPTGLSIIIKE